MTVERENQPRNYVLPENNLALESGLRYSPEAIRQFAWEVVSKDRITPESIDLKPHPSPLVINDLSFQRDYSIACYLHLVGFIGEEEFYKMSSYISSKNDDIVMTKWDSTDHFISEDIGFTLGNTPSPIQVRNVIRSGFKKIAEDVNFIRSKKDVVVALVHGKFNGFPHTGYFQMYKETMMELEKLGYKDNEVVFVLAGDTNKNIELSGHSPFLNTLWRLSMNSYIPYDFLCSSGEFGSIDCADEHWVNNYSFLRPDFIHFDSNDSLLALKLDRIRKIIPKIKPIIRSRHSEGDGFYISQTNLRTFSSGIFTVRAHLEDLLS